MIKKKKKIKNKKKAGKKIRKAAKKKSVKSKPKKKAARKKKALHPAGRKKSFNLDHFQPLIDKGRERGFVTYSDILYAFPVVEKDINGLEKLYDVLEKQGIEIKEAT